MEETVVQTSLFKVFLNHLVQMIAIVHQYIMGLNDNYGSSLSDKQLHFLVVGFIGLFILFVIYPLFKWLTQKGLLVLVAWIFTFCILVAITLLIEIGQDYTGTGTMDFADIMSGLFGFVLMSIFGIGVIYLIEKIKKKSQKQDS